MPEGGRSALQPLPSLSPIREAVKLEMAEVGTMDRFEVTAPVMRLVLFCRLLVVARC